MFKLLSSAAATLVGLKYARHYYGFFFFYEHEFMFTFAFFTIPRRLLSRYRSPFIFQIFCPSTITNTVISAVGTSNLCSWFVTLIVHVDSTLLKVVLLPTYEQEWLGQPPSCTQLLEVFANPSHQNG